MCSVVEFWLRRPLRVGRRSTQGVTAHAELRTLQFHRIWMAQALDGTWTIYSMSRRLLTTQPFGCSERRWCSRWQPCAGGKENSHLRPERDAVGVASSFVIGSDLVDICCELVMKGGTALRPVFLSTR